MGFILMGFVLGIIVGPIDPARGAVGDFVDDFSAGNFFEAVENFAEISAAAAGAALGVEGVGVEMDGITGAGAAAGDGVKLPVAASDDDVALGGFFLEDQIAMGDGTEDRF